LFTGLVEEIGKIESITNSSKSASIVIKATKVLEGAQLGDSICTNGVCLTITSFNSGRFSVDVMAETMRRSNLKYLNPGDEVNLERALRLGDRLGGHMVSGHVDGTGIIEKFDEEENAIWTTISADPEILKYVIHKGSIAIDGVSLTVAYVDDSFFKVSIIPHTKEMTTLLRKKRGSEVNLECDMVGKYIEKLIGGSVEKSTKKNIDMGFLSENGFV